MSYSHFRNWIKKMMGGRRQPQVLRRSLRATFRLEQLDDRLTPSAVSWTGGGDGSSWSDPNNWSDSAVPGSADDVTIGSGTINFSGTDTVNSLTITGGKLVTSGSLTTNQGLTLSSTITNTGTLTVGGAFTWTNGALNGIGTTVLDGSSSLSGGFFSMLTDQQVDNYGTATIADTDSFDVQGNAVWDNELGSTLILQGSGSIGNFFAGSSAAIDNYGTVQVAAGSETAAIAIPFNNSGTVDVQSGTLSLTGGGTGGGTFTIDEAGAVFSPGNYTLQGATVSGPGTVSEPLFNTLTVASTSSIENLSVNGGTLTVNGALDVQNLTFSGGTITASAPLTLQSLTFSSGTLTVSSSMSVNGTFTWTGGTIKGAGDTTLNGTTSVSGSSFTLNGQEIDNFGTAAIADGSSIGISGGAVWDNEATGILILQGSGSLGSDSSASFTNDGMVEVAAGTETAKIGVAFNNSGTVDVQSGTFQLTGGGTGSGAFSIDEAGAVFIPGNYTLDGATFTGPGTVHSSNTLTVSAASSIPTLAVSGGTVDVNAPLEVQNLTFSGGTISVSSTLTIDDSFTWTNGTLSGTGTSILNGTSSLSGGTLTNQQVDNYGTATMAAGDSISFTGGAIWDNESSGTFDLLGTLGSFFATSAAAFNNFGTLDVAAGSGTSTIGVPFNNSGTVDVQSGTFSPTDQGTGGGTFTLEAGAVFNPGQYTLASATITGPGMVTLNTLYSPLTVTTASTIENMTNDSGTLDVTGTLTVQNLIVDGTFSTINNTGTLTVTGPLTWTEGALSGVGTTILDGASSLNGGFSSMWTNDVIDNYGTATFADTASVDFKSNTVWNNEVGGTLSLQGSGSIDTFFAGTGAAFNNAGLIQVNAGTETAAINVMVNNSGTIEVDSGTFSLPAGFTNTGAITVAPGAAFTPDPTTTSLSSNGAITGSGQKLILTATVTPSYPGVGRPTGSVSFYDGTTLLGSPGLPSSGPSQVTFTTSSLAIGDHTITAVYNGNSNYLTSTSAGNSENILSPGFTVIESSLYVVGANTTDSVVIKSAGKSTTGSTGLLAIATLNNVKYSKTYLQPFSAVYVFEGGGNDTVTVTPGLTVNSYITAGNGTDHVHTAGGNDIITLGSGSDVVTSGNGNKTVTAQDGSGKIDTITLGAGTDVVMLGGGNDHVVLGLGNHTVTAGNGTDSLTLGNGNNSVTLGNGTETVHTGLGTDVIAFGTGNASIVTGNGNKSITAGTGDVTVTAGTGTDVVSLGNGRDAVALGGGNNTVTLGDGTDSVTAGIGANTVTLGNGADDKVTVGAGNNVIVTGNGNGDSVMAGSGKNTVTLGNGTNDKVTVTTGNNVIVTGNGNGDSVTAGSGDNLVVAGTGLHTVTLGPLAKGSNILIDGSVTLTQQGVTLGQVLAEWIAGGNSTNNVANIRSQLQVTYNTSHTNHLTAGAGLDWFWYTDTSDVANMTTTDLHN